MKQLIVASKEEELADAHKALVRTQGLGQWAGSEWPRSLLSHKQAGAPTLGWG